MEAVGIHVFAGGFTAGVQKVFDVKHQLEVHNFGLETASQFCEPINCSAEDWPKIDGQFAYGNPRCTGFSTITSGYAGDTHGPCSRQTRDIHELCKYAAGKYDIIVWESVQQAYTTGRPLLDDIIRTHFVPNHYRIAHCFISSASFGNAQNRKRYFFVAYRDDRNFNISPPSLGLYQPCLYDAIWDLRDNKTTEFSARDEEYGFDSYLKLTPDEKSVVPILPHGYCLNAMGRFHVDQLPEKFQWMWKYRKSEMPFSMHGIYRIPWRCFSPTLHSSACRFIHPDHDRPLTVGECATIMGWEGFIPKGRQPVAQIAKGVVPQIGTWLAEQARDYLNDEWGDEDFESTYRAVDGEWVGGDSNGALEKVFDMTEYRSYNYQEDRFHDDAIQSGKRFVAQRKKWAS